MYLHYLFVGSQGAIECTNCGAEGPADERAADPCSYEAAWEAWNRRGTNG